MHSILESDGVSSDPFEVLSHMGTLIIEGRIPKAVGDSTAPSESGAKSSKPYNEGPHCPIFMKLYNKDPHNVHKCTDNHMLCIRYNNLKQSLQNSHQKSPSICIEVSLGPDCLCGELRSQSTLLSTPPSKRDIILEQWTITIGHKQMQEPSSQMSVLNLYQAVRSLLHFSQLTAWYMSHQGMKPAHVIYRVGTPEDSTFISDDNFVNHDFPVADVNKQVWMKISVKTLPRMEKIPSVFCPHHSSPMVDATSSSHFEGKEPQKFNKEKSYLGPEPLHSKFSTENKEELLENKLPLKFQGVRKKTNEAQERKRKKHITLYDSPSPLVMDGCSSTAMLEVLDGIPIDVKKMSPKREAEYYGSKRMFQGESLKLCLGESSKAEFKKSKPSAFATDLSDLVKPQPDFKSFDAFSCNYFEEKMVDPTIDLMIGLKSFSDSKSKSDFRTKGKVKSSCDAADPASESVKKKLEAKTVMDILDDRMQISCAISGKHHCKWECEEESDLNNPGENVEKPKRRRSLSKARATEGYEDLKLGGSDSEKILHGKFKEVDCWNSYLCSPLQELDGDETKEGQSSTSTAYPSSLRSTVTVQIESPLKPKTSFNVDISSSLLESTSKPETPKIKSLPLMIPSGNPTSCEEDSEVAVEPQEEWSSRKETSPDRKEKVSWVRKESFESFRRGCASARDSVAEYSSDSDAELSGDNSETLNPFLAAILRTTKKSKSGWDSKKAKKCDSSVKNKLVSDGKGCQRGKSGLFLEKLKDPIKCYMSDLKAKVDIAEKVQSENPARNRKICCEGFKIPGKNSDLRLSRKKSSPVKNWNFEEATCQEFPSKSLNGKMKNLFGNEDLKHEEKWECEELFDEIGSNNLNGTKTIPVPSALEKMKFRRSLDSAAQLVFHRCSGLPLTSSPAPVRRNNSSFSFDSSLNSVSAIKSALFEPSNSLSSEDENESEGSLKSPASPGAWSVGSKLINYHSLSPLPLLGSFEESVLNGRLEPVSTVQGFTAELGASGSFCPRHLHLPVTVFFYTLGDNDKVSAPYLGHINLGKKGYNVPRSGTIQVTLFNPMRTVVKMFVVVYDLHDMPVNSHTFLRQRTLYVPASQKESTYTDKKKTPFDQEDYHKYLRYLIHLRFVSGKTGRIYLHTDIRMVIFRKADEDTATALGNQCDGESFELRSHTHGPLNPKFSPRK